MDAMIFAGEMVRITIAALGFGAMWALWNARELRSYMWTDKLKEIWLCHIMFVGTTVSGNLELVSRNVAPTASLFVIGFIYLWTIKSAFNGDKYTKDPED